MMKLKRLNKSDSTWDHFEAQWKTECDSYSETFDD